MSVSSVLPAYSRTNTTLSQDVINDVQPSLSVFEAFVAQHITNKPAKVAHTATTAALPHLAKLPKHKQKPSLSQPQNAAHLPTAIDRRNSTYSTDAPMSLAEARSASTASMDSIAASSAAERQRHIRRQSALSQYSVALSEFDDASEQLPIAEQYWPALAAPTSSDGVTHGVTHRPIVGRKASIVASSDARQPPANRRQSVTGIASSNYNMNLANQTVNASVTAAASIASNTQTTNAVKQANVTPISYMDPAYADLSTDGTFYFHSTLSLHMPSLVIDVSGLMGDDAGLLDAKHDDTENNGRTQKANTHKWSQFRKHETASLTAIAPSERHQRTVSQVYNEVVRGEQSKRNEAAMQSLSVR